MADNKAPDAPSQGLVKIKVRAPKANREVEFSKDLGENLADAVGRWGEDVVFAYFKARAKTVCATVVRNALTKEGATDEAAIKAGEDWQPTLEVRRTRTKKDPMDALLQKVASGELTEKDLKKMLEERLKQLKWS